MPENENDGDARQVRPFADWLLEQGNGATHVELTEGFNALVGAVIDHGKGGEITLSVKVKPAGKGGNTLITTADVKVKAPRGDRPETLFFADANRNLTRENPMQPRLPLRDVSAPNEADLKEATK